MNDHIHKISIVLGIFIVFIITVAMRPPEVHAISCGFGSDIGGGTCQGFLTATSSNTTFTSPSDWNNASNTVECIGGGGSGAAGRTTTNNLRDTGGGGGAYSLIRDFSFATPGTTQATYRVGAGGATTTSTATAVAGNVGADTYFATTSIQSAGSTNLYCGAKGGSGGLTGTAGTINGGAGGVGTSGWGQTRNSGGAGGTANTSGSASGGGGAAGNSAVGGSAAAVTSATAGAGAQGDGTKGGTGGAGATGTGTQTGGTGVLGTEYTTQGSGGGGGAGRTTTASAATTNGGGGGIRGGGGGGSVDTGATSGTANGGIGSDGIIIVTYTPVPSVGTSAATAIADIYATLNGSITTAGSSNATVRGFAYGTVSTLSTVIATTSEKGTWATGAFTFFASGLKCGTTYYSRAYATDSYGTGLGSIQSFNTTTCSIAAPTVRFLQGLIKFTNGYIKIIN